MEIYDWFVGVLNKYPECAVYLAVGSGFIVGKIKVGFFSLGTVAAALLVGLLVGQTGVSVPGPMRSAFFLLFLFTTGYAVGPQFFQSIAKNGIKQVTFALFVCFACFISVFLMAKIAGYNAGQAGGLFAGSQTISGALGIVPETIQGNPSLTQEQKDLMIGYVPVCYSITYIFGAAGSAFILGIVGPRILGGLKKVKQEVHDIEQSMGDQHVTDNSPAIFNALRQVTFRAYHVTNEWFTEKGRKVSELELKLLNNEDRLFVARIRHQNVIFYAKPDSLIYPEDDIVLSGRREYAMNSEDFVGPEIADFELLNFSAENLPVMITKKTLAGKTVLQLMLMDYMYGVSIKKLSRGGINVKVRPGTELMAGDMITVAGIPSDVERAAKNIGYIDRPTNTTDVVFLCLGIVFGIFFGSLMIKAGKIPISLGTSGGTLLVGLFLGWLRSKKPTFGRIPDASVWLMRTLGLSMYVAVIGISAAPSFGSSLKEIGISILWYGAIATTIPLITGILLGKYVFKFNSPTILGCIAGSRTSTPSLGAITDQLNSDLPTIGYSLTYAVGVVVNLISALILVLLMF
ncbi:MAG: aspartate-alanine antiporter [Bacteroidales bacterium]|nr:aspartate-alanine antiporter [Bacteroidales bacterium]